VLGLGIFARVVRELRQDVAAARDRDPAARTLGGVDILLSYGGVHALLAYRVAHGLHEAGLPIVPHALSGAVRMVTGVEIHPAARIGESLFIDHGTGVVVGETAEIGDNVTLYQGVTLGGTGFQRGKRHPTIEADVVIGSGAKLLGPIRVGRGSKVGANSVVIHDVPPNSTVVGNPGHPVRIDGRRRSGPEADWAHLPDPVADAIKALAARVAELEGLLADATGRRPEPAAEVRPMRKARGPSPAGG
jgi:serine O-acetyltransferase